MYLVDTNVISAGARSQENQDLADWMDRHSERLYLSAISIAEIEAGIAKLRREGSTRRANSLTEWLETLLHLYAQCVLPFDVAAARIAGGFSDSSRAMGRQVGFPDVAIAATAKVHKLTILTRNLKHFGAFELPVHDPFASLPAISKASSKK